ncbi:retrovirus-related pol polyprotein from transposon TNT 1-94 [Tanacetum coccineum]
MLKYPSKKWLNTLKNGIMEHVGQEVLKLMTDWQPSRHNSIVLEEKSRRSMKRYMLLKEDVNNVKDSTTPKITHSKKKVKPLKKLTTINLVALSKEGDIEQHLRDSTRGTMQALPYSYGASHINNSIPQKEKDLGSFTLPCYINHVFFDNALADLGASVGKFVFSVDFIILDMPEDVKVPLILGRPFLSTAYAKIDVFKRKITLRVRDEKIIFKSMKPASSLIKRVYMLGLRERMELDLEARIMGETLLLNRSLDPLYDDYIKLNDLNVPLELRRDQVDDLMPTIEEGEIIDEPMIDIIKTRNNESFDEYPSFYDFNRKIHIDCAYNLRFSCMIGFEHVVVENIDGYRDQDMGDIILGEPFCKDSCVEARRFDRLITIHNGSDNMTYQMARSHPRFKHLSNAQCNKIKPLLKNKYEEIDSDIPYSISIKENMAYLCLHFTKDHEGAVFRFPPYQFAYPEKKLTMEEMLAKFINEGKREHEEMEIFIRKFRTTNELLLKEHNLLSELKIKVNELSKVMNEVLFSRHEVKGVTTRGGKMTFGVTYDNEINNASNDLNEPSGLQYDKTKKPREVVVENESPKAQEQIIQPLNRATKTISDREVVFDMEKSMKKPSTKDDECYNIDDLDKTINEETQVLLENDQLNSFLLNNLEKTITQSDQENCNSIVNEFVEDSEIKKSIRRIDITNMAYSVG